MHSAFTDLLDVIPEIAMGFAVIIGLIYLGLLNLLKNPKRGEGIQ